ncbi:GAF domain-containing sensor histidine kinase [Pseudarthrobacter sp. NamE2]|uniref:GAF domain-containing sensor histidine kinase n=1 Tax=Pseudarthrobacter sp. NamE2 TaxID=2576838 RepID=UPI0010FD046D|nr:GAF domain-containing sensor histidine kinase [Pseudarthrobacter sp. NamE2]TLM82616.1 GAF domain-containing sensor histidine kinase [Pseudarthrobacter sp. NamE2]
MQMLTDQDTGRDLGLREYGLLPAEPGILPVLADEQAQNTLNNVVRCAASLCGVPYSVVNIISSDQQLQIAASGIDAGICSRDDSMCATVFLSGGTTVVRDASRDPRFSANPFVTGEIADVRFYASVPLKTSGGWVLGSLCVFSDQAELPTPDQIGLLEVLAQQVVELLELQHRTLELNAALEKLERSNAMLAEFAGRVSHDLRAPLTTILGYVELAEDDPEIPPGHPSLEYLGLIESGGLRMLATLEDVLDYSRADGVLKRERVSLLAVTAEAAQDLGVDLGLGSGILCEDAGLYADRAQLRTLVQNLLANSLNYRDPGRQLEVTVTAETCPRGVTVRVADNGKGILPADRKRAVEPLVRLNRPGDGPGTGLGLATCCRIAQAHGGELSISDTPGGGTTVSVLFPAEP